MKTLTEAKKHFSRIAERYEFETSTETITKKYILGKEIYNLLNNDLYKCSIKLNGKININDQYRGLDIAVGKIIAYEEGLFAIYDKYETILVKYPKAFYSDDLFLSDVEKIFNEVKRKVSKKIANIK